MKATEIKEYREAQLELDSNCPLCGKEILKEKAALDHCHRTGKIRRPLHTWCNSVLGRIENWSKRGAWDNVEFLKNVIVYLESDHTDIIHPSHGRKKRRKVNAVAKKSRSVRSGNKKGLVRKQKKD